MIIGNGDIASVLPERDDLLFFASGVSNSQETNEKAYKREMDLLLEQHTDAHIVYFSSLGVLDGVSRYFQHKRDMESTVKENFDTYTIIRIGNILWGDNPHTFINYFRNEVAKGHSLNIKDEYRYVVDQEEFLYWIDKIPDWSCEMNIPGRRLSVKEIVDEYVHVGLPMPKIRPKP